MKKWILIIIGLIIAIIVLGNLNNDNSNVIEDERTYNTPWREPIGDEFLKIGKLMVANGIKGCGEYHVKEVTNGEYVVACTPDGKNWTYYVAWPNTDKIYRTNEEMESKLTPPR
ncbi:hypothetical protein [Zobellia uliginosa]|uniref:hypothetical protein n=1 Tax=Zobellia uliginosa TaxID=143224 RepID=UPI0026E17DE4|nr:hypothetical protein [Zobellia uliginosa]MDO6518142.1 hypothetical protein [Zobellia uliginosa]